MGVETYEFKEERVKQAVGMGDVVMSRVVSRHSDEEDKGQVGSFVVTAAEARRQ